MRESDTELANIIEQIENSTIFLLILPNSYPILPNSLVLILITLLISSSGQHSANRGLGDAHVLLQRGRLQSCCRRAKRLDRHVAGARYGNGFSGRTRRIDSTTAPLGRPWLIIYRHGYAQHWDTHASEFTSLSCTSIVVGCSGVAPTIEIYCIYVYDYYVCIYTYIN